MRITGKISKKEKKLCRTQVLIEAPGAAEYFLNPPLANHQIIVPGKIDGLLSR